MPFGMSGQILYHWVGISSSRRIIFFELILSPFL
jgi:hypothetical protein